MDNIEMINRTFTGSGIIVWDNSVRAKKLLIVFWILIATTFVSILSDYMEVDLLERINNAEAFTQAEANNNDVRQGIIGMSQTVTFIISVVVFLNWFRRAYGNLTV